MKTSTFLALLASCMGTLAATASEYAQCGGKEYKGPTTCASGLKCYCQSVYYSQCLKTNPGWTGCSTSTGDADTDSGADSYSPPPTGSTGTTSPKSPAKPAPTTPKASPSSASINHGSCAAYTGSKSGYATTTHYYDGQVGACGCSTGGAMSSWQANPATKVFTAAGSQNLFGGSGSWCGGGCGKCYQLTNVGSIAASGQGDCTGAGDTITVMITNLCPANGNEVWCSQPSNQYGYGAHFDIMSKDGPLGWNNPVVQYQEVPCPGSLTSDYATCQCATGATSRVRRGLMSA